MKNRGVITVPAMVAWMIAFGAVTVAVIFTRPKIEPTAKPVIGKVYDCDAIYSTDPNWDYHCKKTGEAIGRGE